MPTICYVCQFLGSAGYDVQKGLEFSRNYVRHLYPLWEDLSNAPKY
jgi:hypothetical protein